jgi:hypothetical protein
VAQDLTLAERQPSELCWTCFAWCRSCANVRRSLHSALNQVVDYQESPLVIFVDTCLVEVQNI